MLCLEVRKTKSEKMIFYHLRFIFLNNMLYLRHYYIYILYINSQYTWISKESE